MLKLSDRDVILVFRLLQLIKEQFIVTSYICVGLRRSWPGTLLLVLVCRAGGGVLVRAVGDFYLLSPLLLSKPTGLENCGLGSGTYSVGPDVDAVAAFMPSGPLLELAAGWRGFKS